jgi:predicted nicotinamide N-methyase
MDYGAGSGVLAVCALSLGAASAVATDVDALAVGAALSNGALNGFMSVQNDITARKAQQDKTKDVVGLVTSKLISMKNDFRTTTTTLTKQVDALKNQVELEKRRAVVQQQQTTDWLLNMLLVILSLVVIVLLARKLWSRPAAPAAPAYTRGERRY